MNQKTVFCFILSVTVLTVSTSLGAAQGICVLDEMKVSEVRGRVLLEQHIIRKASVELWGRKGERKLIAKVETDEKGHYSFAQIPPGKYVVIATYTGLVPLYVPVRIEKSKGNRKELIITLGPFFDEPCGGGSAELREPLDDITCNQPLKIQKEIRDARAFRALRCIHEPCRDAP